MVDISKQIKKVRKELKKGPADILLGQKPFATGMYRFSMFMISYYSRVRVNLKIDYDSFMIIQTVVSHSLYNLQKKNSSSSSYQELETEWERLVKKHSIVTNALTEYSEELGKIIKNKLSMSSICLVTTLPKETVRRKVNELCNKNLLKISKKEGIILGSAYKNVFQEFVPQTTLEVCQLIKEWDKTNILKYMLKFKI